MYHTIEFAGKFLVDLEMKPSDRLARMVVDKGTRMFARVRPYVVETIQGPVEVADLCFEDGSTARAVPFERFSFVDK
jgi:hypothetical protein